MVKTQFQNIAQLYSILGKIRKKPTILSDSDNLTKYIIAKALLHEVQNTGDLRSLILKIERKPVLQYFSQPYSIFPNLFFETVNFKHKIDNSKISTSTEDLINLKKIYNSYKINKKENIYVELLYCLWILFEFLDPIDSGLLKKVFFYLKKNSSSKSDFSNALMELDSSGFIYIIDESVASGEVPLEEIFIDEDYNGMLDDLKRLVPLFSELKEVRILLYLGNYFYSNDYFDNAIISYKQIIKNKETGKNKELISGSYNNWGLALVELKQFEEACVKYEKATEIKPEYAHPYNNWGLALVQLKQFEEACAKYEKAIEREPGYVQAYFNCGVTFYKLKQFEEAYKKYENAIKLKPYYVEAYNNSGNVLGELEKFEEACIKYKKAIEIDPEFAGAYYNLARTLEKITYYKTDKKNILELFTKAFFLFVLRKEWKFANKVAILNIINKSEQKILNNTVFIFNMGITSVLNPNKKKSKTNLKSLENIKKRIEKKEKKLINPYIIVIDAILESKPPKLNVAPKSDDLMLNAAIILANEIVSVRSSSSST